MSAIFLPKRLRTRFPTNPPPPDWEPEDETAAHDDWLRFVRAVAICASLCAAILLPVASLTYWAFFGGAK